MLVSCKPADNQQVKLEAGMLAQLEVSGNLNRGINAVNTIDSFVLTLKNNGKLPLKIKNFNFENPEIVRFIDNKYPGLNGTCVEELVANQSCTLSFQSFGNKVLEFSEAFTIEYLNGVEKEIYQGVFTGAFGEPAKIQIQGPKDYDFGLVEPHVEKKTIVTLKNIGQLPARNLAGFFAESVGQEGIFYFTGANKHFPGVLGTCSNVLLYLETCQVEIAVKPITTGSVIESKLAINYTNPNNNQTSNLSLRVEAAEFKAYLTILERDFNVGNVLNGISSNDASELSLTVVNNGYVPATDVNLVNLHGLPLEFKESNCEGVLPGETCQYKLKVRPNFSMSPPTPTVMPVVFFEKPITLSYNDGKFPALAYTQETLISMKVLGEAYFNIYKDGDFSTPFNIDQNLAHSNILWPRANWEGVIGSASIVSKNIIFSNGKTGATVEATNIIFEMTGPNQDLKFRCLTVQACAGKLGAGGVFQTGFDYTPLYRNPFVANEDYVLKISYFTGLRTKTIDLKVETKKMALPLISVTPLEGTVDLGGTIPDLKISQTITVKNDGPLPYELDLNLDDFTASPYFSIPEAQNNCKNNTINNGQTCSFVIDFYKATYSTPEPADENYTIALNFTNGLDSSDANYETFNYTIAASIVPYKKLVLFSPTNELDFKTVPWSNPGKSDKVFVLPVSLKKEGKWKITHFDYEVTGPDAQYFSFGNFNPAVLDGNSGDSGNVEYLTSIALTSPNFNNPTPLALNANLVFKYYGRKEEDFVSYLPGDRVELPVKALIQNEPYVKTMGLVEAIPRTKVGGISYGKLQFKNTGQVDLSGSNQLKLVLAEDPVKYFSIDPVFSNSTCRNMTITTTNPHHTVVFDLAVDEVCDLSITYEPQTSGDKSAFARYYFKYSSGVEVTNPNPIIISGRGTLPGTIATIPEMGNSQIDYFSFGDNALESTKSSTFTLSNPSANTGNPIEIDNVTVVPMSSSGECLFATKLSNSWKDYLQINGVTAYSLTSNTCTGKRIANVIIPTEEGEEPPPLDGDLDCSISVSFSPNVPNRLLGACLKVSYQSSESLGTNRVFIKKMLGYAIPPTADFNGWKKQFAIGETENTPLEHQLEWRPMSVSSATATIMGYNVYRRKVAVSSFPSNPVNESLITIANGEGDFSYRDIASETNQLDELSAYIYEVRAVVKFGALPDQYELVTAGVDKLARVIAPSPYTVFFSRTYLNTLVCNKMLGISFSSLNRTSMNACSYNGYGSVGGLFDYGKSIIVDMYENSLVGGAPSNLPGYSPKLYNSLSDAKTSCSSQKVSIPELNLSNISKRLINRIEYMIGSSGYDKNKCNVQTDQLKNSGESDCLSDFKLENLIGNAWDLIDGQLIKQSSGNKWAYSEQIVTGTRIYPVNLRMLVLDQINFNDYSTYYQFSTYAESFFKCFHPLYGTPLTDVASSCPGGSLLISSIKDSLGLNSDYNYIQISDDASSIFENEEGTRLLFAGGSYKSREVFGIDSSRYTMFWTNPYVETIFTQGASDQRARWEGGAARCILDIAN